MAGDGSLSPLIEGDAPKTKEQQLIQLQQPGSASDGLFSQLTGNAFFTAGAGLALLGAAANLGQKGVRRSAELLKRRLLVDVEINVNDPTYPWFLYWMRLQHEAQASVRAANGAAGGRGGVVDGLMRRFTPGMHHLSIVSEETKLPNGASQTNFALVPGPGRHLLRYKNAFLLINRVRETKSMDYNKGRPWETVTLTTLYSQRSIFSEIFREAHSLAQESTEGKTIIYHPESIGWKQFGQPRRKRPLSSVILDQGISDRIVTDVREFLGSSKWYFDRGVPYRRGYLLYGPPGSGKTSFIQALAGELDYGIAQLNLSQRGLTDDRLNALLQSVPQRTIVLLEDADAAFANRRRQQDADGYQGANVTFSGLLNSLDGVASAEERILFLTTNHVERMDEALIRPGRVDMAVHLGDVSRWQVSQFWDRFYGDIDPDGAWKSKFMERLEAFGIIEDGNGDESRVRYRTSAAALQGLFLYNKGNLQGALDTVEGLLPEGLVAGPGGSERKAGNVK